MSFQVSELSDQFPLRFASGGSWEDPLLITALVTEQTYQVKSVQKWRVQKTRDRKNDPPAHRFASWPLDASFRPPLGPGRVGFWLKGPPLAGTQSISFHCSRSGNAPLAFGARSLTERPKLV